MIEATMPAVTITIEGESRKMPMLTFYAFDLEVGATAEMKILITDAERLAFFQKFVGRILDIKNVILFDIVVTFPHKEIPINGCWITNVSFDFKTRTVTFGIESNSFIHEVYM